MSSFTNTLIYSNENIYKIVLSMEDVNDLVISKNHQMEKTNK